MELYKPFASTIPSYYFREADIGNGDRNLCQVLLHTMIGLFLWDH
jgi:hypothetical protein